MSRIIKMTITKDRFGKMLMHRYDGDVSYIKETARADALNSYSGPYYLYYSDKHGHVGTWKKGKGTLFQPELEAAANAT